VSFSAMTPARRARAMAILLLALLVLLVGRAGWIQLVRGEELAERAERQHFTELVVPAPRGRILDRHGRPLAASHHARTVAADPQLIDDVDGFAVRVAFLLDEAEAAREIAALIAERKQEGRRFVYLRRRVDRDRTDRLATAGLEGLILQEEPRREHPHGRAAAAVLGVVGADDDGHIVGLTGLERLYDATLRGQDGQCRLFRSGKRECLNFYPEHSVPAVPGRDLATTLDITIQQIVEDALDDLDAHHAPRASCAVVLDPWTGEVLAMAGRPALDPDRFPAVGEDSLRIPAVQFTYEPGSTFKPLIMSGALSRGAVHTGEVVDCGHGLRFFGGRRLTDVHPYGSLELADILVKSSNIGIATVGQALGCDDAFSLVNALGFGRRTGIELEGEQAGKVTPRKDWHENYTLVSVSMGHEIAVTPIQLAAAYCALLNGGRLFRPTLLRSGPRPEPRVLDLDASALAYVRGAMERVVGEGTARRARVDGLRVGGKTGTSEKYPEGSHRYFSSFVGFAPVDDPRLVVLVVADEPEARDGLRPYGGVVAAPVVGEILRRSVPLLESDESFALPESGVRHNKKSVSRQGKVKRVAAVHRSSVSAGERDFPVEGRNPDSVGVNFRRSAGR